MTEQASKAQNTSRKTHAEQGRPPFECIALLLQGGGALGAYQAGVYQALSEAQLYPDWVAGISIGAINAALIAGNSPETRLEKLRQFWECVTIPTLGAYAAQFAAHSKQWPILDLLDRAAAIAVLFGANSAASSSATESPAKNFYEVWARFGASALSIYPMDFGLLAPRGDVARGLMNQIGVGLVLALPEFPSASNAIN
jgi:hypothetical protein